MLWATSHRQPSILIIIILASSHRTNHVFGCASDSTRLILTLSDDHLAQSVRNQHVMMNMALMNSSLLSSSRCRCLPSQMRQPTLSARRRRIMMVGFGADRPDGWMDGWSSHPHFSRAIYSFWCTFDIRSVCTIQVRKEVWTKLLMCVSYAHLAQIWKLIEPQHVSEVLPRRTHLFCFMFGKQEEAT